MTAHQRVLTEAAPTTTEDRLSFQEKGLTQMRKLAKATRDLYAALTPDQQTRPSVCSVAIMDRPGRRNRAPLARVGKGPGVAFMGSPMGTALDRRVTDGTV